MKHISFTSKVRIKTKSEMIKSIKKLNIRARFKFFVNHLSHDTNPSAIMKFMNSYFERENNILTKAKYNVERAVEIYNK
jgi:hypothetical protein